YPERADVPVERLDLLATGSLTFEAPDLEAFPCLRLAREAANAGGGAPCVMNAANEVAVHAFLEGTIAFTRIPEVIEATLDELGGQPTREFEQLFALDHAAREMAARLL
ncbi:MAG TPA: 1-deoxy-D-xylulose-5-phosphate reductoisomerase, partial [Solirubrobacteraceae bacterium]